jgi:hypothetical protein
MSLTSDTIEDVRLAVYQQLSQTGLAPTVPALAGATGLAPAEIHTALAALHDSRDIVLRDGRSCWPIRSRLCRWVSR